MQESYDIFEGMTSISAVIKSITSGISDRSIIKVLYDRNRSESKSRELRFLAHSAESLGFALEAVDSTEIDNLTSGTTHGGIIAVCTKRVFSELNVNFLMNKELGKDIFLDNLKKEGLPWLFSS